MQTQHTIVLLMFENPKRNLSFWKPSIDPKGALQPGGRHALNYLWLSARFGRTLAAVCTRSRSPAVHQNTSLLCVLHGIVIPRCLLLRSTRCFTCMTGINSPRKSPQTPTAPTSLPSRGTCKCRIVGHNLVLQRFQVEGSRQAGSNPLRDHKGRP